MTREIKEKAKEFGADLVGIANIERFKGVPAQHHPASIFPEAKSVIVLAREINRGAWRGIEEGTYWMSIGPVLDPRISYELCRYLENKGWEGIPIYPIALERWPEGVSVSPDKPAPNIILSFEYAAVAAGLGEIGLAKVFLTPEFGPRQALGIVITDASFEPDPIFEGKICEGETCMECVKACPLKAINPKQKKEIIIAGRKFICAELNFRMCRKCPNGVFPDRSEPKKGEPNRLAASCIRACIAHLEEKNRLKKKYRSLFRKREPWFLDVFESPIEKIEERG